MNEKTKQILAIVGTVILVAIAIGIVAQQAKPEEAKVEVVGTLEMPEGGGRGAEAGTPTPQGTQAAPAAADAASGMPADMVNPR